MMTEKDTMQVKPEKKEDRRVRRTKKLLTHGLIQLMKEKQVQDITVRELADLVDVNRGTFYLYYRDIFDMLDSIEQELFNQVNQLIAAHKGETVLTHTLPVLKELFRLVEENKELCQVLLGQNGDMKFLKKLSDVVQEAFRREGLMMKKDEVTFDYSYAFGALGFVGLLRTWLERDCVEMSATAVRMMVPSSAIIITSSSSCTCISAARRPVLSVSCMALMPLPPRDCTRYSRTSVRLP